MSNRYLILVRHANSRISAESPSRTWPLSAQGEDRARQLAAALQPYHPSLILTSSEPKAVRTGELMAEALGLSVEASLAEFDEVDRAGIPYAATPAEFQAGVARFFAQPGTAVYGPETAFEARGRFADGLYELIDETPNDNIVLVSHATVMALFAAPSLGMTPHDLWLELQRLGMPAYIVLSLPDLAFVALGGLD